MEQNFFDPDTHFNYEGDSVKQQWHSIPSCKSIAENDQGSFDCNICLESAQDPVVTLCGHLYCWPCIYKWLHVQNAPTRGEPEQPTCPVCKANISAQSLIPLYCHGRSSSKSEVKRSESDLGIPRRPAGLNNSAASTTVSTLHSSRQLHSNRFHPQSEEAHLQQYYPLSYGNYAASVPTYPGSTSMGSSVHPAIGLFGEMVYARIFGGSDTRMFAYPHSFAPVGRASNRRMRRHEMQLEKSLNRVSIFLFCCLIICLILF